MAKAKPAASLRPGAALIVSGILATIGVSWWFDTFNDPSALFGFRQGLMWYALLCFSFQYFRGFRPQQMPVPASALEAKGLSNMPVASTAKQMYLDLVKRTVTNLIYEESSVALWHYDDKHKVQ